jgi:hypothetical protein
MTLSVVNVATIAKCLLDQVETNRSSVTSVSGLNKEKTVAPAVIPTGNPAAAGFRREGVFRLSVIIVAMIVKSRSVRHRENRSTAQIASKAKTVRVPPVTPIPALAKSNLML